jgi:hypothetical protein
VVLLPLRAAVVPREVLYHHREVLLHLRAAR